MLDVDDFKRINDTAGHAAGDAVLRELGNLLQGGVRGDDVASRLGGDEFILVLPDMSREMAGQRAELLCQTAGQLDIQYEQKSLGAISLSAGVAAFPQNGLIGADLLKAVDAALYAAKQGDRGSVVIAR